MSAFRVLRSLGRLRANWLVVIDPKRTCVAEVFRSAIRLLNPIPLTADPCCNNLIANIVGVVPSPGEQCDGAIS